MHKTLVSKGIRRESEVVKENGKKSIRRVGHPKPFGMLVTKTEELPSRKNNKGTPSMLSKTTHEPIK